MSAQEPKKQSIIGRLLCAVGYHVWTPYFDLVPEGRDGAGVQLGYRCERCDARRTEAKWPPEKV
jgi:predicted type IV restriction endonuclease